MRGEIAIEERQKQRSEMERREYLFVGWWKVNIRPSIV